MGTTALALSGLVAAMLAPTVALAAQPLTVTLAFVGQPADAEVDTTITTARVDPAGDPVTVAVMVAGGTREEREAVEAADLEVDLRIEGDPMDGAVTLGGATAAVENGVAAFGELTIDVQGRDFTLVATLEATVQLKKSQLVIDESSDPSQRFTIWEEVVRCGPGVPCNVAAEREGSIRVDVDGGATDGTLLFSLLDEQLVCPGDHSSAPFMSLFDAIDVDGEKTATVLIDRAVVQQDVDNGRAHYQVCYLGDAPFVDRDGSLVGSETGEPSSFGPSLLPDCQRRPGGRGAPCVESRTGAGGGDVKLTIRLPAGDPGWM